MDTTTHARPAAGIALVEVLVASSILAVAAVSFSAATVAAYQQGQEFVQSQRAGRLGAALAEQACSLPYDDPEDESLPGPEPGERGVGDFDNADDYDGYAEPAGQLRDAAGNLLPSEYQGCSRSVSADYQSLAAGGLGGSVEVLEVTVTVVDQATGQSWVTQAVVPSPAP